MNTNSPDYLTYKKSKISPAQAQSRRMSKLRIAVWIFVITFSVMFAIVVQVVRKYATKIDIEYGRNQSGSGVQQGEDSILSQGFGSDAKKAIDKRLKLIQLEENAPNEAKVISENRDEVIDLEQFAKIKESGKLEEDEITIKKIDTKTSDDMNSSQTNTTSQPEIAVYSKVLIGKYPSFEDARAAQDSVRALNQGTTPFIRKVGDVYALQVGSYQDLNVARQVASKFRAANFDVWIYQQ